MLIQNWNCDTPKSNEWNSVCAQEDLEKTLFQLGKEEDNSYHQSVIHFVVSFYFTLWWTHWTTHDMLWLPSFSTSPTNNPSERAWTFVFSNHPHTHPHPNTRTHTHTDTDTPQKHTASPLYSCPQTLPGCRLSLCRSGCSPRSEPSSGWADRKINQLIRQKLNIFLESFQSFRLTFWMVPLRLRIIISTLCATSWVCLWRSSRTAGSMGGISAGLRDNPRLR